MFELLKKWWGISSPFRHAMTAFLSIQLAVPLAQVADWASSKGATALPNWHSVLMDLMYASIAALIAAWMKWAQNKRAFPVQ